MSRKDIVDKKAGLAFPLEGPLDPADPKPKQLAQTDILERMSRYWDITKAVSGRSADGGAMAPKRNLRGHAHETMKPRLDLLAPRQKKTFSPRKSKAFNNGFTCGKIRAWVTD